ncbi:flagellar protein [Exiguobacterium mexicanum]|uniref:Flagellar protein n=2 Tax=Exiguobacterium mexicanum TaxID=340146 RepID=A0ABT7MN08_9BACL|nr:MULTISPECIES: flagellar protein [Exiguobacterium]MDL5376583.1 flagellar protein [Exiguobacterium mexicanum]
MKQSRSPYCPSCAEVDFQNFLKVRDFIREPANKQTTIGALVEATGVSELDITRYIHEGRLIIKDNPSLNIACVRCGNPTNQGKVCAGCQSDMQQELKGLQTSVTKQSVRAYRLD